MQIARGRRFSERKGETGFSTCPQSTQAFFSEWWISSHYTSLLYSSLLLLLSNCTAADPSASPGFWKLRWFPPVYLITLARDLDRVREAMWQLADVGVKSVIVQGATGTRVPVYFCANVYA